MSNRYHSPDGPLGMQDLDGSVNVAESPEQARFKGRKTPQVDGQARK